MTGPELVSLVLSLAALALSVLANVHRRRAVRLWRTAAEGWEVRARRAEARSRRAEACCWSAAPELCVRLRGEPHT